MKQLGNSVPSVEEHQSFLSKQSQLQETLVSACLSFSLFLNFYFVIVSSIVLVLASPTPL